jgi:DNA-directed RNA polymerase subunit RPC12/RpoP
LVSLLKISKVELKCMNCDKANEVAVIENTQGFNEAGLSCVGCAEKIFAKMRFSLKP